MTQLPNHHNGPNAECVFVDDFVDIYDHTKPAYQEALRNWYGAVIGNYPNVGDSLSLVAPTPETTTPTRRSTLKWWSGAARLLWAIGGPLALLRGIAEVEQLPHTIETAPELECWAHRDSFRR